MSEPHGDPGGGPSPPGSPFLVRQVETHLIFGPLSRRVPLATLALAGGIASLGRLFFLGEEPFGRDIHDTIGAVILPLGGFLCWYLMRRQSLPQQAIAGWVAVKCTVGFLCFVFLTAVVPMYFFQASPNAWPALVLALVWVPGLEFIPGLTPHQRYMTLMRILLSVPCLSVMR